MLCRGHAAKVRSGAVPVFLNVYDLTPINGYAYWFGLGIYHSGVQVHGVEYAFGAHDAPTTGIFEGEPKKCAGFTFRKSILIGRTDLEPKEVRGLMEKLADNYTGNTYNLITKNCNHFCNDACLKLTGEAYSSMGQSSCQNRLGSLCNCVLPTGLNTTTVRQGPEFKLYEGERKKLRSNSARYSSTGTAAAGPPAGGRRHMTCSSLMMPSMERSRTINGVNGFRYC